MKRLYLLGIIGAAALPPASAQLIINEIMQSNIDCVYDDIHEFPDSWVELYNPGGSPEYLAEYSLGLTDDFSTAWHLPTQTIAPGEYTLIFCDKAAIKQHTDFRLESGKGDVYLFKGTEEADHISHKKQPAPNIAYGRKTDGADKWGYQTKPTPGAANCGEITSDILDEPVFSVKGGFFTSAVNVALLLPDGAPEGTKIRYTTDGSEPVESSAEYTQPITLSSSKSIRAKLFCEGWLSPRSTTHSFIFHGRDITLPLISIATDHKYFYDSSMGIYIEGKGYNGKKNYEYDWRRPINIEMFEPEGGEAVINQLCETRVKGGATRGETLKSLAVYANKRFGTKRFEYEFFPEDAPGLTDWKSIELRNSGNDHHYTYMRDGVMQASMGRHADLDWQPWQPAIIYLNGKYLGILNIRSRSNEDHTYTFHNGIEDVDVIEAWGTVKEGDDVEFKKFKDFYAGTNHTLDEYREWMDVEEFINYFGMNLLMDNKDWPGNNINMWRQKGEGHVWRWIAKDTDFGLGLYGGSSSYKTLNWINTPGYDNGNCNWANGSDATRLFRRLMDIQEFKDMFIDRMSVYMGDFLRVADVQAIVSEMKAELEYEYPHHRKLINMWWPNWNDEVNFLKNWYSQRHPFFYRHIAEYYKLGSAMPLTVSGDPSKGALAIMMNGVKLSHDNFDGKWHIGRTIRLSGEVDDTPISGWRVTVKNGQSTETTDYSGAELSLPMPECTSVAIEAVYDSGVETIDMDKASDADTWYDLAGRRLRLPTQPGIYIRNSKKVIIR